MVADDDFSARYDLNRIEGVFSRPEHKLYRSELSRQNPCPEHRKGGRRLGLDALRNEGARHLPQGDPIGSRQHHSRAGRGAGGPDDVRPPRGRRHHEAGAQPATNSPSTLQKAKSGS